MVTTIEGTKDRTSLVLTRMQGEAVEIGDNVTVEVAEIRGGKVRLRFHAPQAVKILRKELRKAA